METFGKTLYGFASAPQSYAVGAENLSENLIIRSSAGFQIALTNDPSEFTDSLHLTVTDGKLPVTTIYVRFTPSYSAKRLISGSLLHYSGSEQANFAVQGLEGDPNIQQEVLLTEDFNDCNYPTTGWEAISLSSNKNWECLAFGRDDSKAAEMNGHEGDEGSNDWLVSPQVNLAGAEGAALNFWTRSHYGGDERSLMVYLSTAFTGDVNTTDWVPLNVELPQAGSKQWVQLEVDLSAYEGEEVHIAFQYKASNTYPSWTIDDFNVVNKEATDYYIASFLTTDTVLVEESAELTAKVFLDHKASMPFNLNLQLETINTENIDFAISPEMNNEQLITLHFAPGDSVKTLHMIMNKNAALVDTAMISLLLKPSFYVAAGDNSSYSITVPAEEQEEVPEPELEPTGVNEALPSRLKVYPNPATTVIQIDGLERSFNYKLRSMGGKLLSSGTYDFSQWIAIGDFGNGLYLLQLEMDNFMITRLIMINK